MAGAAAKLNGAETMKMDHSNWTLRFPRTTRCDGYAIFCYRKPLHERVAMWLFKYGWALVLLAVFLLSGCADDVHAYAAAQADLADAIADAAKDAGK